MLMMAYPDGVALQYIPEESAIRPHNNCRFSMVDLQRKFRNRHAAVRVASPFWDREMAASNIYRERAVHVLRCLVGPVAPWVSMLPSPLQYCLRRGLERPAPMLLHRCEDECVKRLL